MTTSEDRVHSLLDRSGNGPLAGIVVADLSRVLAGPYCTMLLADMGALVVKVESPGGDDTRGWAPPRLGEESTYYLSVNRNKHSIALDLKSPADLAVVRAIIERADVLVENFKPGGLEKFGLDYETVSRDRPDLVYASISGFGTGPGADLPGYDLLAQAVSGMMDLTGYADGEPLRVGVALFDVMTGLHAATGILAALHERGRSGRGQHIELNLLMSALSGLVNQSGAYAVAGVTPSRLGNDHPSLHPYGPFPARDKELIIAVGNDSQFAALCRVLGVPELSRDARYTTNAARNEHREALRTLLVDRLRTRDAADWFALLKAANVPAAPILTVAEGTRFAEELALAPVVVAGGDGRAIPTVRHPIDFSRSTVDYPIAPPPLDADRAAVLAWLAQAPAATPAS
jgi:crotonobetainyl-CoA:carnitine CoA-transferase CaiB-like acyl-CoA transferase